MSPRFQRPSTAAPELQLIERLRAGDRAAQTELVRRYHGRLLRQAFEILHDRALAEDAVQDTWLVALTRLDRFEGRASLLTWLTGIVINRARDCRRKESRVLPLSSLQQHPKRAGRADGASAEPALPGAGDRGDRGTRGARPGAELRAERRGAGASCHATVRRSSRAGWLQPRGDERDLADHRSRPAGPPLASAIPAPHRTRQARCLRVRRGPPCLARIASSRRSSPGASRQPPAVSPSGRPCRSPRSSSCWSLPTHCWRPRATASS